MSIVPPDPLTPIVAAKDLVYDKERAAFDGPLFLRLSDGRWLLDARAGNTISQETFDVLKAAERPSTTNTFTSNGTTYGLFAEGDLAVARAV